MIFNSDSFYEIGSSHKHCDDFALTAVGNKDLTVIASIADGCSNSAKSNYGAMILPQVTIDCIYYALHNTEFFQDSIINSAIRSRDYLNLPSESLDATLFIISTDEDDWDNDKKNRKYRIFGYGDGAILKICHDNTVEFDYIEYPSGAPLYINYYSSPSRLKLYEDTYGLQRKIYRYKFTENIVTGFNLDIDTNGQNYFETGLCSDYKAIFVMSDGIGSFVNSNNQGIEISLVIRALADFKSYKGEFIQRRMNGFNKYCINQGWKHLDDFSVAGIHIDNP